MKKLVRYSLLGFVLLLLALIATRCIRDATQGSGGRRGGRSVPVVKTGHLVRSGMSRDMLSALVAGPWTGNQHSPGSCVGTRSATQAFRPDLIEPTTRASVSDR